MANTMWIAIEGGDGVGKTTLAQNLTDILGLGLGRVEWIPACGGAGLGSDIRQILKNDNLPAFTEECLFAAVLGLMAQQIKENELNGITTITDRSHVSSIVYSTIGKQNPIGWRTIYDAAVDFRMPDVIIHLYSNDLDEQIRRATKDVRVDAIARYDSAGREFYEKINNGFVRILSEPAYKDVAIRVCVDGKDAFELAEYVANLVKCRRYRNMLIADKGCITETPANIA